VTSVSWHKTAESWIRLEPKETHCGLLTVCHDEDWIENMSPIFSTRRGWRYYRNLILVAILALLVAFYVVIPLYDANRRLHPDRYPIGTVSPADLGLSYIDVTLSTKDGLTLFGWYVPSANGAAVILAHAFNGNRTGCLYHAALLAKHGYGVLLYDARAQGESEGERYAFGWDAHWDILAALDYLQQRPEVDPERIGVLGLSAGGAAALRAAAETHHIAAVVAEGAGWPTFEDWLIAAEPADVVWAPGIWMTYKIAEVASGISSPMPIKQAVTRIAPAPLFLIAAGEDRATSQGYLNAAGEPKAFWDMDEPGHIDALFKYPDEYERRVVGFFDQALLRGN
jgi:pimeloyl-ACP methyl ester carboxylesterase